MWHNHVTTVTLNHATEAFNWLIYVMQSQPPQSWCQVISNMSTTYLEAGLKTNASSSNRGRQSSSNLRTHSSTNSFELLKMSSWWVKGTRGKGVGVWKRVSRKRWSRKKKENHTGKIQHTTRDTFSKEIHCVLCVSTESYQSKMHSFPNVKQIYTLMYKHVPTIAWIQINKE